MRSWLWLPGYRAEQKAKELASGMRERLRTFGEDEQGITVIEILLLVVVVIGLVLIFRKNIEALVRSIFSSISVKTTEITGYTPQ